MKKIIICISILFAGNIFSQTNDMEFNSFFQKFRNAVKDDDITEIAELTNFPFIFKWVASEIEISRDEFISNTNRPLLIGYDALLKAKFRKTVTISKSQYEEETVYFTFEDGYYIISYGFENTDENWGTYSDCYFGLINGEYKYIKIEAGD